MNYPSNSLKIVRKYFPNVRTVTDSKRSVDVTVTKEDTAKSSRKKAEECALARACCRELKMDGAIIGLTTSYLIKGNQAMRFKTSEVVQREIVSFDRHGDFDTGTYRLSSVPPSTRMDSDNRKIRQDKRKNHISKGAINHKVHKTARIRHV